MSNKYPKEQAIFSKKETIDTLKIMLLKISMTTESTISTRNMNKTSDIQNLNK